MSKTSQTGALVIILILLIPCSIAAILGFMNRGTSSSQTNENPEHLAHYDNKLWFYTSSGELLGTYSCETANCKIATGSNNDQAYPYMDGDTTTQELPVINDHLVFLQDSATESGSPIFLYDMKSSFAYKDNPYLSIKHYNALNDLYIVENSSKQFGILKIGTFPQLVVQFENSYIGLLANEDHNILLNQNNKWIIMDSSLNKKGDPLSQTVISVSKDYIAVNDNGIVYVINYEGLRILPDDFLDGVVVDKYAGLKTEDNEFVVYDLSTKAIIGDAIDLNANDKVTMKKENNELVIMINDKKNSSIKIS